jgi:hypothetical protein
MIHQFDGKDYRQLPIQQTARRQIYAKIHNPQRSITTPGYPVDTNNIQNQVLTAQHQSRNTLSVTPRRIRPHPRFGKLPEWQLDLLRHTNIYDEHTHLLISSPAIIVSDGGVEGGKGYFGVCLAVGRVVIARVRGVARGDPRTMCSFRAEAYGFLAGICLLANLTLMLKIEQEKHTIHTDSASLLSRLLGAMRSSVTVGFWLKTDSDIIMQIAEEAKKVPQLSRHYVKGHQDDKKKARELTLPEIYNIDADKSATKMRHEMNAPASQVIPFPASPVGVYIQHQLISSSLDSRLHEQFTTEEYWDYLQAKYEWTEQTRRLIAWEPFHKHLKKQPSLRHRQLMKYTNGWLPTGYSLHRNNPLEDHHCPHCKTVHEKDLHLLRCPHPDRKAKRHRFLTVSLNNFYHTSNTAQPLRALISQNLIQWFRNPHQQLPIPRTHPLAHEARHQQAIGWRHFLQGRIAQSIIDYQEQYYRERERPETETGEIWIKKLIQVLWAYFFDVWKIRCEKRHELDNNRVSRQHTHRVHARTRAVYAVLDQLPAEIRNSHHFDEDLTTQIGHDTRVIETWLAHTEPLVQQGLAETAQGIATGHYDIRDFFMPLAAPPPPSD